MTVTRGQIIIFLSIIMIGVGIYLTSKAKLVLDDPNAKWGNILTWGGAIILLLTSVATYKIVPKA